MGTVTFRLAIPFQPFAWGCWDEDETDTCCEKYDCPECGGSNNDTNRLDCRSAYNVSEVVESQWRAWEYAPNQYFTACNTCPNYLVGYLTYGLPPVNQFWPRCNDCSGMDALQCVFTAHPMPDLFMIDQNTALTFWYTDIPDRQPEDTGERCCEVVPQWSCAGGTFPYRTTLYFSTGTPATGGFVLQQYAGSPTSCLEPANARDVYVRKELWVMPNLTGSGNCIRLVAKISYQHTFTPTIPDVVAPGGPTPCTCAEVGRAWVGPQFINPRTEISIAWYYLDVRSTDTFVGVQKLGMRLFRLQHSEQSLDSRCGAEEGALILNSNPGCDIVTNPSTGQCFCLAKDAGPCTTSPLYNDCPDWPSGESEVPCTPRGTQTYPNPPPNTHFDFPNYIFFSI